MAQRPAKTKHPPRSRAEKKKAPPCPECGSPRVIPIVHGFLTPALQKAVAAGEAKAADREEWEGMTEWFCKECGCDWSVGWRRFKRSGGVNATR